MARLLVAGLLMAAATPVLAQPAMAPVAPMAPMAARAPMMAKTVTRAEVQANVQKRFAKRDANRDGFLTTEEMTRRGGAMKVRRMRQMDGQPGARQAMRDPNVAFDRLDANRDGNISRDEFARNRVVQVERRIVRNGPGQPGVEGMPHHGGVRVMHGGGMRARHGGGMLGAAVMKMADANRDGRVSLAEATAGALQHFDMMDSNRDGALTPQERAAGRIHMRQMRRAG